MRALRPLQVCHHPIRDRGRIGIALLAVGVALVTGVWADFVAWVRDSFVSDARLPI